MYQHFFLLLSMICSIIFWTSCTVTKPAAAFSPRSLTAKEQVYLDSLLTLEHLEPAEGLEERKVIYRNIREIIHIGLSNQKGTKIVADYFAARDGSFIYAKIKDELTTTKITKRQKVEVEKALLGYRVEPKKGAPLLQHGKITIKFHGHILRN